MQYTQLSRRSAGGKIDWEKQYLTFIPVEDAVFTWAERAVSGHLEYSVNGGQTWVTIANGESTPTITAGNKVMWKGDLKPAYSTTDISNTAGIGTFSASGNYHAYGNTMSLLFYDNYYGSQLDDVSFRCAFEALFYNDIHILTAPLLPSTTISRYAYVNMFYGCTNLTKVMDRLPATILAQRCYQAMFSGCTSLTTAPELPATILTTHCYDSMFHGCTSLTTAPELPATTLADYCYANMFRDCTSLIYVQNILPATTLDDFCYAYMFRDCVNLTAAPELLAETLTDRGYIEMFHGCTRLSYIKCLATDISAGASIYRWTSGVASTGTFVKAAGMEDWPRNTSGIPRGWTVIDDNS